MKIYTIPSMDEQLRNDHADNALHHTCRKPKAHEEWHGCECGTRWCDEEATA